MRTNSLRANSESSVRNQKVAINLSQQIECLFHDKRPSHSHLYSIDNFDPRIGNLRQSTQVNQWEQDEYLKDKARKFIFKLRKEKQTNLGRLLLIRKEEQQKYQQRKQQSQSMYLSEQQTTRQLRRQMAKQRLNQKRQLLQQQQILRQMQKMNEKRYGFERRIKTYKSSKINKKLQIKAQPAQSIQLKVSEPSEKATKRTKPTSKHVVLRADDDLKIKQIQKKIDQLNKLVLINRPNGK